MSDNVDRQPMGEPSDALPVGNCRGHVDFAILTIREDEFEAVLERFSERRPIVGGLQSYEYARVSTVAGAERGIAIVRSVEQGQGAAQAVAHNAIVDLEPRWLILAGIAGGAPDVEFTLGDVLLASRIHDFSVRAVLEDGGVTYQSMGGGVHPQVARILAALPAWRDRLGDWNTEVAIGRAKPIIDVPKRLNSKALYGPREFKKKVLESLVLHFPNGTAARSPIFRVGPVATSNSLVKNAELLDQWLAAARHLTHVEMEAGGAYMAARSAGAQEYPLLCVRGISDIVGFKRGSQWTEFACHAAASFVHMLVRSSIIELPSQVRTDARLLEIPRSSGDAIGQEVSSNSPVEGDSNPAAEKEHVSLRYGKAHGPLRVLFLSALGQWTPALRHLLECSGASEVSEDSYESPAGRFHIDRWAMSMSGISEVVDLPDGRTEIRPQTESQRTFQPDNWLWVFVAPLPLAAKFQNRELEVLGPAFSTDSDVVLCVRRSLPGKLFESPERLKVGVISDDITSTIMTKTLLGLYVDTEHDLLLHHSLLHETLDCAALDLCKLESRYDTKREESPYRRFLRLDPERANKINSPELHAAIFTLREYELLREHHHLGSVAHRRLLRVDPIVAHYLNLDCVPRSVYFLHRDQYSMPMYSEFATWLRSACRAVVRSDEILPGGMRALQPDAAEMREAQLRMVDAALTLKILRDIDPMRFAPL